MQLANQYECRFTVLCNVAFKAKHIIQKIAAFILLSIFVFAITPKKFLHDAVTQHHHSFHNHSKCNPTEKHITANGYNCITDNVVVDIPFNTALPFAFTLHTSIQQSRYLVYNSVDFYTAIAYISLRGPPYFSLTQYITF